MEVNSNQQMSKSEMFVNYKTPVLEQLTRLIPYIKTSRKGG